MIPALTIRSTPELEAQVRAAAAAYQDTVALTIAEVYLFLELRAQAATPPPHNNGLKQRAAEREDEQLRDIDTQIAHERKQYE